VGAGAAGGAFASTGVTAGGGEPGIAADEDACSPCVPAGLAATGGAGLAAFADGVADGVAAGAVGAVCRGDVSHTSIATPLPALNDRMRALCATTISA